MKARNLMIGIGTFFLLVVGANAANPAMVSPSAMTHQKQGVTCINCHGTNVPVAKAPVSACLQCHANSKDGRYVGTGAKKYAFDGHTTKQINPHVAHLVDLPCTECHKTHVASVNYCNNCHLFSDMAVK